MNTIETIIAQLEAAKPDLDVYKPADFAWYPRAIDTANLIVPWLCKTGNDICGFVEEVAAIRRRIRHTLGTRSPQRMILARTVRFWAECWDASFCWFLKLPAT